MQPQLEPATPSLAASTELLVMAPIRPGWVPSLDTLSYKSRVKRLLKLLHAGRQGQHEYRPLRAVSDAVERVGVIRSLRVAVVEGRSERDDRILLSVHFDGSYEAYARTIWQRSARLLDLIFCNSADYPTGWDHPFDTWNAWIRSVQVSTPFFYATPGLTYHDQTWHRMLAQRDRGRPGDEADRSRIAIPTAEEIAWSILRDEADPTRRSGAPATQGPLARNEALRQNLGALAGLWRLTEVYRPGTADGEVLRGAAHELLPQLCDAFSGRHNDLALALQVAAGPRMADTLAWFSEGLLQPLPPSRQPTPLPAQAPQVQPAGDVQAGILRPHEEVTHGVLLLLAFANRAAAAGFLQDFETAHEQPGQTPVDQALANLALTPQGLLACGLSPAQLEAWPLEFRQGMAARAGLLGDVRWNHPRRWKLPPRNGGLPPDPRRDDRALPPVPLEAVHAVLQFRVRPASAPATASAPPPGPGPQDTLISAMARLRSQFPQVELLSVQWLQRQKRGATVVDHFGYGDGESQPEFDRNTQATRPYARLANQVHLGEVLLGHANAADRAADLALQQDPERWALMHNGSFLVLRKLQQDVAGFRAAVARTAAAAGLPNARVRACMMGRWPADAGAQAGHPLAPLGAGGLNDFDYRGDPHGDTTPLASHIRRANPRELTLVNDFPQPAPGGRAPRILRRSLSYGPAYDTCQPAEDPADSDRGLMFMAYNASIAEQFEVIQGWLAGGNSSRTHSGATCPFLGVPEAGQARNFRFMQGGQTVHMAVDGDEDLGTEPRPLVRLEWGLYAFAPSRSAQLQLAALARRSGLEPAVSHLPWSVQRGQDLITRLQRLEAAEGQAAAAAAWKATLEDPESVECFDSASVWAAVRQLHGGLLRMPYGVLVASPELVDAVLRDETHATVTGYRQRLVDAGMGPIFLGRDADDPDYARLSQACNLAIAGISRHKAFEQARAHAQAMLQDWAEHARALAADAGEADWELALDSRDLIVGTLARLCEDWFGLDGHTTAANEQKPLFQRGAWDWRWQPGQPVCYPGHFTAASRATFQPQPSDEVRRLAAEHGHALTAALRRFIEAKGPGQFSAPVSRAVLLDLWNTRPDDAVHTIAGALMGFLPTTEGVLRRVLAEWTRDGSLLDLAGRLATLPQQDWVSKLPLLEARLREAMKYRPVPEQIWRQARQAYRLVGTDGAGVLVQAGERLILGQVSALHRQLEQGDTQQVHASFGGRRGPGQATHACPGYEAAIGAMLGLLAAALEPCCGRLAPSAAPGVLVYRGPAHPPHPAAQRRRQAGSPTPAGPAETPGQGRKLLAFGDSWMRFQGETHPEGSDFQRALAVLGYDTSGFAKPHHAREGYRLAFMREEDPADDRTVYGDLRRRVANGDPPLAVLLGAGGNDFVDGRNFASPPWCESQSGRGAWLERVLRSKGSDPCFEAGELDRFILDMQGHLDFIIRALAAAGGGADPAQQVPLVVHAYDHPVPDGRAFNRWLCPWMAPVFTRKGYAPPGVGGVDPAAAACMAQLIDRLNDAYAATVRELATQARIRVQFVRLTGVLAATPAWQQGGHQAVWKDELHPNRLGFAALAQRLHDEALAPLLRAAT